MIDRSHALSVVRQAELTGLSRASVYYLPRAHLRSRPTANEAH